MGQFDKIWHTYQGIIFSLGMILLVVLGTIFGIIPAVEKVKQIRDDSIALSDTISGLQSKVNALNAVDEQTYTTELQDLVAAVPLDKSLPSLFSTIDAISGTSGVTVSDMTLTKPGAIATGSAVVSQTAEEKKIGSSLIPFTVTVVGSYTQIHDYLVQVLNVRRFFRVRNFEISFTDPSNITVHMGMDAFYSPLITKSETITAPLVPFTKDELKVIATIQKMPLAGGVSVPGTGVAAQPETTRPDPFSLQ